MKKNILPILLAVIGLTAPSIPGTASAASGDLFVSAPPEVLQVSLDGTQTTLPALVVTPTGVVSDKSGNVYIADSTTNSIVKIDTDGNQTIVATGLNGPEDLALDAFGNLYVANSGNNAVVKIATDGTKTTFASGLNDPQGLAFDATGNLFVSNAGNDSIVKIATNGTKSTFVSTGLNAPAGLAFDAQGNLLVADSGSDSILQVAPDGTVTSRVSSGLDSPNDVSVDGLGNLLVADSGSNSILKVAPDGTISTVSSSTGAPQFLAAASGVHQLLNIATRGFVETGDHVLIGGFIVRGEPTGDLGQTSIVIRAIGPSLADAGVSDPLADPVLELHDESGNTIATNDNWKDSQQAQIEATGLAPSDDRESAIMASLPDGSFTAIVRGSGATTGVALVEVYKIQ